jgi:hypothetical protein
MSSSGDCAIERARRHRHLGDDRDATRLRAPCAATRRERARPPSTSTRGSSSTRPRMRPTGSRGGASTRTSQSTRKRRARWLFVTRSERTSITGRRDVRNGPLRHTVGAHLECGRRDGCHELCVVAARTTGVARRASPLGPAGRFARSSWRAANARCSMRRTKARHARARPSRALSAFDESSPHATP